MGKLLVKWLEERDRHIVGLCLLGRIIIRIDRDRKVTGMYTFFGSTEKYVPNEEDTTIKGAKVMMEVEAFMIDREERLQELLRSN